MGGVTPPPPGEGPPPPEVNMRNDTPPPGGEGTPRGRFCDHDRLAPQGQFLGLCKE
jgi:hypothetical protein